MLVSILVFLFMSYKLMNERCLGEGKFESISYYFLGF
jgi:hypothetical protein